MPELSIENLESLQVDPVRGFLPSCDPLERLPAGFEAWERTAAELPALLMTNRLRATLERLPVPDVDRLEGDSQLQRAMLLLTTFGNAYVWAEATPAARIPRAVAAPLWRIAEETGLLPIATHASTVLHNWRRLDKHGPIDLDNLAALQVFAGGIDEQWFYLTAVVIEAKGAAALPALVAAQRAAAAGRAEVVAQALALVERAIAASSSVLDRIPEKCDPHIFYHRVRPYLTGWPPPGVVYEGVDETPRLYAGGSAAQSALIQSLDAGLGVRHSDGETRPFLMAMRNYMQPGHRRFVEALEAGPSLRQFVLGQAADSPQLADRYNACLQSLDRFRRKHMEIAVRYISHQAASAEEAIGTGGTSFVSFLSKARKETSAHRIEE